MIEVRKNISYRVAPEVFVKFPDAKIGIGIVTIRLQQQPTEKIAKTHLSDRKQEMVKNLLKKGVTSENYQNTNVCLSWKKVFATFSVENDKVCTLETMYKRLAVETDRIRNDENTNKPIKKANLGHISNVVDLCNCVAVETDTPMGVLPLDKIVGNMTLRYGKEGEMFIPLGRKVTCPIKEDHIVLSDNNKIISWLWTYMVSDDCCVPRKSDEPQRIIVCADQAEAGVGNVANAVQSFIEGIKLLGGTGTFIGVVDRDHPELTLLN